MRTGLIGYGYWGKILKPKLEKISNLKFVCTSKDNYENKLYLIDWVFIATPNSTHFDIVKKCILSRVNVFCEKPLTLTYKESLELYELADEYNVKLYVNDVFNYRDEKILLDKKINKNKEINVTWSSNSNDIIYDLLYHDLYLLYNVLKKITLLNWPRINNVIFNYSKGNKKHFINDINFTHTNQTNDALLKMINHVLYERVNYKYNKEITLFCNKIIDDINNNTNI